ncbi:putative 26S proteasome regulatory subunit [Coniosporium tulheliwenetii]|nr:putative 26S proteasome regulatory subunit [Cladosporium sp. JES 115]
MNTSLTTFDGYPRDDIDVAQIRTTRARIIHLKNDYKDLMNRIEAGLHAYHASAAAANATRSERQAATTGSSTSGREALEAPFAKVNSVVPDSPADTAGLKAGDSILRFGTATWMNHEKLSKVAEVVSQNEGRPIPVKVSRRDPSSDSTQELQISLTPRRNWGGRGLLGCHLLPL